MQATSVQWYVGAGTMVGDRDRVPGGKRDIPELRRQAGQEWAKYYSTNPATGENAGSKADDKWARRKYSHRPAISNRQRTRQP